MQSQHDATVGIQGVVVAPQQHVRLYMLLSFSHFLFWFPVASVVCAGSVCAGFVFTGLVCVPYFS
jgi:hypothetical protein